MEALRGACFAAVEERRARARPRARRAPPPRTPPPPRRLERRQLLRGRGGPAFFLWFSVFPLGPQLHHGLRFLTQ